MGLTILVLPGDGIGKEVTAEAVKVLHALDGGRSRFAITERQIGMGAYESTGEVLSASTLALAEESDAILFGATGGAAYDALPAKLRNSTGLRLLRKNLGLFANFRPAFMFPELIGASTLKPEVVDGLDMLILRELNGDLYYGEPRGISVLPSGERIGINTMSYTESEIERIAHVAFQAARKRRRKVCSVDKSNVLEVMLLWREIVTKVGTQYPDVELSHLFVDAAAMTLMRTPKQFDVMVTPNVFGDILSDAAAMLTGSIGMLPSAAIGLDKKGLYEPVHGCAPDIAGQNIANPLASILSAAMMLRHSFELEDEAAKIEKAVRRVLAEGLRTVDIYENGTRKLGTKEMGDAVVQALNK
jgi:3-isopropylmalate dehydrogenase